MGSTRHIPLQHALEDKFHSLFAPLIPEDAAAFLRIHVKVQDKVPVSFFLHSLLDSASPGFRRLALPTARDAIRLAAESKGLPPLEFGEVQLLFKAWELKNLFVLVK